MKNRLREIRLKKKISPQKLAESIGTTRVQINRLENGMRRLSDVWIEKLAPALGVRPQDLIADGDADMVWVVGKISYNSEVSMFSTPAARVSCPPGMIADEMEAYQIEGNANYPALKDGEYIYCMKGARGVAPEYLGKDCVIKLADARMVFATVHPGSRIGVYRLAFYNAPEMADVEIEWAAKREFTKHV